MTNEQVLNNIVNICKRAQKAGVFELEEAPGVVETLNALVQILKPAAPVEPEAPKGEG